MAMTQLEDFPFSSDVLYVNNEWWADSDDEQFGPSHFRDLVALALHRLVQNPYWTRLWIIQEVAVSPTASMLDWGDSSASLQTILTLADIFCNKVFGGDTLSSHMANDNVTYLSLESPVTRQEDPRMFKVRLP
jgi:hypothetical protein